MKVDIFNTDSKYQIIYADPPWEYKQSGSKTNSRGMAKQHYQMMNTDDICKLPVRDIATDNALLFIWATFPNILGISKNTKVSKVVKSHAVHQIVQSHVEQHSKKPAVVREKITALLGEVPRIELFARQQAEGWDCWGNEV